MSDGALRWWFETYLEAFNRGDFDRLGAYYAQDVQFDGQAAQLHGRLAVIEFYRAIKARVDEHIELLSFIGSGPGDRIFAELRTTLTARDDWPDFPTGPLAAGASRHSINFVLYEIEAGRFSRIRSARFAPLMRRGRP